MVLNGFWFNIQITRIPGKLPGICWGDAAYDILCALSLIDAKKKEYTKVKEAFVVHFIDRQYIIYESEKFNSRSQEQGDTAQAFITVFHSLAEHCKYGTLKE